MYLTPEKQKEVLTRGADINVWISDRSGRKSSVTQETLLEEALNGSPFILLRSKKDELISEAWLSEYVLNKYKEYSFYTERVNSNIVVIKVKTPDDEVFIYCYGLYLSLAQKYKSNYYEGFESVKYVVWEECIPNYPLAQNVKHIRSRCMTEIYNVLSIASTIARDNKVQLIWLGNDIKENILNPVTIAFNLLERLEADMELEGVVNLNDRDYTFYFNYFDFDGAVNHWLYNDNLHIAARVNCDNMVKYNIRIKSEFKTYYIYNCGNFIHISDIDYTQAQRTDSGVYTIEDFFTNFNGYNLFMDYPLNVALTMLCSFYGVPMSVITHYFGSKWYRGEINFKPDSEELVTITLDLEKITGMSLAELMRLPEYAELKNINDMRKNVSMTYSNIKIYMLMEELGNILMFT